MTSNRPFTARSAIATGLALAVTLSGAAGCTTVCSLEVANVRGRAFAAPAKKPRLLMTELAMKDETWKDASIYWAVVDPALPAQLQAILEKGARGTNLFSEVQRVNWKAEDLPNKRGQLKPDDLLLVPEMATCKVDGAMDAGGWALSVLTVGIMPLISLCGIPVLKYNQESEWRLRYRVIECATGDAKMIWDSDPIQTNDSYNASWSNTPDHVREMLAKEGARLSSAFTASLAPLAEKGKPLDVEYPYEAVTPKVEIRVNVAEDPALTFVDVDVNDERVLRRDRSVEPSPTFPVQIELSKGPNVINVVARDKTGAPLSRIDITITRHK
jgi:hypothetical protein